MLKPLAGYVLIEPAPKETKTASGIVLPDSADEKPQEGKVLACGPDTVEEDKTIADARKLMTLHDIERMPVTKDDLLVGVITIFDIIIALFKERGIIV